MIKRYVLMLWISIERIAIGTGSSKTHICSSKMHICSSKMHVPLAKYTKPIFDVPALRTCSPKMHVPLARCTYARTSERSLQ